MHVAVHTLPLNVLDLKLDTLTLAAFSLLFLLELYLLVILPFLAFNSLKPFSLLFLTAYGLLLVLKAEGCRLEKTSVHFILRRAFKSLIIDHLPILCGLGHWFFNHFFRSLLEFSVAGLVNVSLILSDPIIRPLVRRTRENFPAGRLLHVGFLILDAFARVLYRHVRGVDTKTAERYQIKVLV